MSTTDRSGLDLVRLAMVLSGFAPLFVLWSIRGLGDVPDQVSLPIFGFLIVAPTIMLAARWKKAQSRSDVRTFQVGDSANHRDHAIVYLLAMVIPLYDADQDRGRQTAALVVAFLFTLFLFFHLRLHYLNLLFAMCGYSAHSWSTDNAPVIVLSKKWQLRKGDTITCYRLSGGVYVEKEEP